MSIGDTLAEARRQAGLTVTQVSQQTRIRETIIRGIERGDFSACGGDFYARGHIRSIARVVGVDPDPLIAEYDAAHGAPHSIRAAEVFEPSTPIRLKERRRAQLERGHGARPGRDRRLRDLSRGVLQRGHQSSGRSTTAASAAARRPPARGGPAQFAAAPRSPATATGKLLVIKLVVKDRAVLGRVHPPERRVPDAGHPATRRHKDLDVQARGEHAARQPGRGRAHRERAAARISRAPWATRSR